jgi:hypothetical protein
MGNINPILQSMGPQAQYKVTTYHIEGPQHISYTIQIIGSRGAHHDDTIYLEANGNSIACHKPNSF